VTQFARATVLTASASALAQGVQLASLVGAARLLGASAFGSLGFASTTAATAAAVAAFAPSLFVARRFSVGDRSGLRAGLLEGVAFCAAAVLALAAAWAFGAMPLVRSPAEGAALAALLVATGVQLVMAHALIGVEQFGALGRMRVAGALVGAAGVLAGATRSPAWAVAGLGVGQLASVVIAAWQLRAAAPTAPDAQAATSAPVPNSDDAARPQRTWALLAALLGTPALWLAQTVVARGDDGAVAMARIAAVAPFAAAVLFVPSQLGQAMFATLARGDEAARVLRRALGITAALGGGPALVLAATSPWWGPVYGADFGALTTVAVPMLVAAGIQGSVAPAVRLLEARGALPVTVGLNVVLAAVVLGGTVALRPWGAAGYAHALAAGFAVHAVLLAWQVRRHLRRPPGAP
jgi:O-antigen/teichoic acid export membrane protein